MEQINHRQLTLLLGYLEVLPEAMSGIPPKRFTPCTVVDLSSLFESACVQERMAHAVFLDICQTFDDHATILYQLRKSGMYSRLLRYAESFLRRRTPQVTIYGYYTTARPNAQGVHQGRTLCNLLVIFA